MAGIYIHIPFCKQACHYCNFHFSTVLKHKTELLDALELEIKLKKDYLDSKIIDSIYFGGGTPSLLEITEIERLFESIKSAFQLSPESEITLEANPDDLNKEKLQKYMKLGINRLSIGIQSFHQDELEFMNRSHTVEQALESIYQSKEIGFENINIDLIFGVPFQSMADWDHNLQQFLQLDIDHLSCYSLTIEPDTVFHRRIEKKVMKTLDEAKQAHQFLLARKLLMEAGFEQYEISNYARNRSYAIHNTNYWLGKPYIGVGPSAHSYNGISRQWNISNNALYIKAMHSGDKQYEIETLSAEEKYNEYVMTAMRTIWGCSLLHIEKLGEKFKDYFLDRIALKKQQGLVYEKDNKYYLSERGLLYADGISSDVFYDSN